MAILRIKRLLEELESGVQPVVADTCIFATSAGNAGTSSLATKATSAGNAGTAGLATLATSAGYSGTARVAHFGSSGTGALSGTAASV
jgi:hypothetical protein